ncbi:Crp/Fnr family transcriptional regulator [Tissierella sp. MSJ-40]|uniref:Crp/Fnr family transcriptional regulator n=1 Tax=Tissierella simiarum TaxID=2841534 RepID=A0ABS6E6M4_9FIRM|nr:Crp/Fnr family transcriptional regulator [Tissierella simiarum]MBU5438571.1 Crp/Fnr family transcriptional regulator [Tissierella simiarum]
MEKYLTSLSKCVLFKGLNKEEIKLLLSSVSYDISFYNKGDVVAIEEDECNDLGIILKGSVEIHKSFPSGKIVTINNFDEGNIFGEALVFSGRHIYPATIISSNNTEIMYIHKKNIINMMRLNDDVLNNFVSVLSNRILMLNERITNLSYDTVRKKIANLLLNEYKKQKSLFLTFPYSRKKMAELLNIPRPSLSRELVNMKDEGIIDFDKNLIKIVDIDYIENCLLE